MAQTRFRDNSGDGSSEEALGEDVHYQLTRTAGPADIATDRLIADEPLDEGERLRRLAGSTH